jgi:CspA family cold shock protein
MEGEDAHRGPDPTPILTLDLISPRNEKSAVVLNSNERRMGRYKDYHREPRRGGFDDNQGADARASGSRSGHERAGASQTPEPVEAIVKWFNAEKGFGFVDVVGGSEAFMHARQLEAAGHRSVSEGARLKVRIGQGQKGPEVTEIIEVLSGTVAVGSSAERPRPNSSQVTGQVAVSTGTVKLYKADKGFGFVGQDGGGKDVFVHATALARAGLSGLVEGQRVRMQIGQGQKGLEAQTIELLD